MLSIESLEERLLFSDDTFQLHSNPTANHTIYLDFNGHTTTGTIWNALYNSGNPIVTPAYSFQGNSSSFTNEELTRIERIWSRVSEDFSPFNINVTTEEPPIDDLIKSTSDTRWGIRVVIGGSSITWYGGNVGGIAFIGSFNMSNDTPVYVFPSQLGGGNEKYVAEAISHEVGHSLGLDHDGRTSPSEEYYSGYGTGSTGWAPIMGNSYSKELTQWSKGEYVNANNTQDDLYIITSQNGFTYRVDDYGNSQATAKRIGDFYKLRDLAIAEIAGIIETTEDEDVFNFSYDGGLINILVNPNQLGPNLDILLEILDDKFNVIHSLNPVNELSANIKTTLDRGEYYVRISGVGKTGSNGYSDYGSLGQYTLIINGLKNYYIDIDEFHEKIKRNLRFFNTLLKG